MKQDEIIDKDEVLKMARQAGIIFGYPAYHDRIAIFAKLVAAKATAKEREACANTVEKIETYEKIERACFKFAAKTIRARGEA